MFTMQNGFGIFSNADTPNSFGRNFNITITHWQENSSVWPYISVSALHHFSPISNKKSNSIFSSLITDLWRFDWPMHSKGYHHARHLCCQAFVWLEFMVRLLSIEWDPVTWALSSKKEVDIRCHWVYPIKRVGFKGLFNFLRDNLLSVCFSYLPGSGPRNSFKHLIGEASTEQSLPQMSLLLGCH